MLLRPGETLEGQLDTYRITATISRGAYGCAFRALTIDGAWRVVKQFEPSEALAAADNVYQRRCFEREADILMRFHSPLMVRGYELISRPEDDALFFVMEHVQGQTLRAIFDQHLIDHGRPLPVDTVVRIGLQLCRVLEDLHALPGQLIYRDLKPANIMWDGVAKRLKLIDFGTARFNADGQQATQGLGTEGYAPPELYGSRALSPATDTYTLGAVLYELLCGQAPPNRAVPTDFRGWEAEIPERLQALLLRALQQEVDERFATAADLRAALAEVEAELAAPGVPLERPPIVDPPRNHHPLMACYCPICGRGPHSDETLYCGYDRAMFHVAMLQIVPRHRPAHIVYLDRPALTLGRNDLDQGYYPEIDLSEADAARHVSRRHATLRRDGTSWQLEVRPTTNVTRRNGQVVPPGATLPIAPGDRLELGDLVATLLVKPILDPTPTPAATVEPVGPTPEAEQLVETSP